MILGFSGEGRNVVLFATLPYNQGTSKIHAGSFHRSYALGLHPYQHA